jgi:hypothetical protein
VQHDRADGLEGMIGQIGITGCVRAQHKRRGAA